MTEIMISIKPKWVDKILRLIKSFELRKDMPKCKHPFRCFIYQTENGGVVGEFTCDQVEQSSIFDITEDWLKDTCVSYDEAARYLKDVPFLYKWRIRSIIEYQEPRPLSQYGLDRPPQSWCYVKGGEEE